MAIAKSIDIALRSNTTQFEAGMRSGMESLKEFSATTQKVNASMDKAWHLVNKGAISQDEYNRRIQAGESDLNALSSGFRGMADATSRAQSVLRGMETETDRYNAKLRELNSLKRLGALTEAQHAAAINHTQTAYQQSLLSSGAVGTATDKLGMQFVGSLTSASRFGFVLAGLGPVGVAAAAAIVGSGIAVKTFSSAFNKASEIVQDGLERLENAANTAERLGTLTSEFQKLEFAANRSNVSTEQLTTGMQRMGRTISSAIGGSESAVKSFRQLGVNIKDLSEMAPDKAFRTLADAISKVQSPFDRMRLTMEIFGKGGAELINVLQGGSKALDEMGRRAEALRIPITEVESKNIKEAKDALFDLSKAFEGLGNVLTTKVAPILTVVVNDMTRAIEAPQEALAAMTEKWKEVATAIATSSNPIELANKLSTVYFDTVSEKAAIASNATSAAAEAIKKTGAAFDPASVEEYMGVIEAASKRQEQLAKSTAAAQKSLQSDMRQAAQEQMRDLAALSTGRPTLGPSLNVSVPKLPAMQSLDMSMKVDAKQIDVVAAKIDDLKKRMQGGPKVGLGFEAARDELERLVDLQQELTDRQKENARTVFEAEKALNASRIETLKGFLTEQRADWAKNNPALAAYDALLGKVAQLKDLTNAGMLDEKKRDQLIAFQVNLTRSAAVAAQEELNKKVQQVNETFRAGLLPLAERNRLMAFKGEIGKSPVFAEASKELEALKSRGAAITQAMRTPLEKFRDSMIEIRRLESLGVKSGGIDRMTAMRAEMEARQQAMDDQSKMPFQIKEYKPAAIEANTQAAFSAFHDNKDGMDKAKEQLALQKKMEAHLAKLARGGVVLASAKGKF